MVAGNSATHKMVAALVVSFWKHCPGDLLAQFTAALTEQGVYEEITPFLLSLQKDCHVRIQHVCHLRLHEIVVWDVYVYGWHKLVCLAISILLLQSLIVAFEKKGLNVAKGVNPRCVHQYLTTLVHLASFPGYHA